MKYLLWVVNATAEMSAWTSMSARFASSAAYNVFEFFSEASLFNACGRSHCCQFYSEVVTEFWFDMLTNWNRWNFRMEKHEMLTISLSAMWQLWFGMLQIGVGKITVWETRACGYAIPLSEYVQIVNGNVPVAAEWEMLERRWTSNGSHHRHYAIHLSG